MRLRGINDEFKGDSMRLAFKKSGYKLLAKRVSWPRVKGPAAVRIDCGSGYAVQFLTAQGGSRVRA